MTLQFKKWRKISQKMLKVMLGKYPVYNILAEGIFFW